MVKNEKKENICHYNHANTYHSQRRNTCTISPLMMYIFHTYHSGSFQDILGSCPSVIQNLRFVKYLSLLSAADTTLDDIHTFLHITLSLTHPTDRLCIPWGDLRLPH